MNFEHFIKIKELIDEAENSSILVEAIELTGFSGDKLVGMLQRFAQYQDKIGAGIYLEVGVFQGLTLISAAKVCNDAQVYGIDNFTQFDPDHRNQGVIEKRIKANKLNNVHLINMDYEDALEGIRKFIGDKKIGTYFVDGPHDYRSQLICLQLVKPYLSDLAVIVVDDCNYRHIRLSNRDFLVANPEFKMIFEAYTKCHPVNMTKKEKEKARKDWWNGVNVIVYDPKNILHPKLPQTLRDRRLYENEHIIHSSKYGFIAPEALSFFSSLMSFRPITALKSLLKIIIMIKRSNKDLIGSYLSLNTFSEKLPEKRFNQSLR